MDFQSIFDEANGLENVDAIFNKPKLLYTQDLCVQYVTPMNEKIGTPITDDPIDDSDETEGDTDDDEKIGNFTDECGDEIYSRKYTNAKNYRKMIRKMSTINLIQQGIKQLGRDNKVYIDDKSEMILEKVNDANKKHIASQQRLNNMNLKFYHGAIIMVVICFVCVFSMGLFNLYPQNNMEEISNHDQFKLFNDTLQSQFKTYENKATSTSKQIEALNISIDKHYRIIIILVSLYIISMIVLLFVIILHKIRVKCKRNIFNGKHYSVGIDDCAPDDSLSENDYSQPNHAIQKSCHCNDSFAILSDMEQADDPSPSLLYTSNTKVKTVQGYGSGSQSNDSHNVPNTQNTQSTNHSHNNNTTNRGYTRGSGNGGDDGDDPNKNGNNDDRTCPDEYETKRKQTKKKPSNDDDQKNDNQMPMMFSSKSATNPVTKKLIPKTTPSTPLTPTINSKNNPNKSYFSPQQYVNYNYGSTPCLSPKQLQNAIEQIKSVQLHFRQILQHLPLTTTQQQQFNKQFNSVNQISNTLASNPNTNTSHYQQFTSNNTPINIDTNAGNSSSYSNGANIAITEQNTNTLNAQENITMTSNNMNMNTTYQKQILQPNMKIYTFPTIANPATKPTDLHTEFSPSLHQYTTKRIDTITQTPERAETLTPIDDNDNAPVIMEHMDIFNCTDDPTEIEMTEKKGEESPKCTPKKKRKGKRKCRNKKGKKTRGKNEPLTTNNWSYKPNKMIRGEGNVFISEKIKNKISKRITQNVQNMHQYLDSLIAINIGKEFKTINGIIKIFNPNFDDKHTNEVIYCVAKKLNPSKNRQYKWRIDEVMTTDEIMQQYPRIFEGDLPQSNNIPETNKMHENIIRQTIVTRGKKMIKDKETKWQNDEIIAVCGKDSGKCNRGLTLSLMRDDFIKQCEECINNNQNPNDIHLIPILMFKDRQYSVHYVWKIKIDSGYGNGQNIGISFKCEGNNNDVSITGIHCDATRLLEQHQLVSSGSDEHKCNCLADFRSNITDLKIYGNPDNVFWRNKYKKMKRVVGKYTNIGENNFMYGSFCQEFKSL